MGPLTLQEGYSAQQVTFTTNYVPADYPEDELYRTLMVSYGGGADQYDIRYDRGENEPNVVDSSGGLFSPSGRMLAYGVSETQSLTSPVSYWFRVLEDQKTESAEFITVQLAFGRGASLHLVEASRPVTLHLADAANRRPRFASSTKTYTINDDSPAGTQVGPATVAADLENDTLTYSLTETVTGTDASHFEINSSTGVITVKTTTLDWNNPADDNDDNSYEAILWVSDGMNGDGSPEAHSDQPTQDDDYLEITIRVTPAPTAVPAKAAGLTATAEPDSKGWVRLAWTDSSDPTISHYQYQTNLGGGVYGEWDNIPRSAPDQSNELDYRAPSIDFAVEHGFRIRAVNNRGPGEASEPAKTTPI